VYGIRNIVAPLGGVSFRIIEPMEYYIDKAGKLKEVLPVGVYSIEICKPGVISHFAIITNEAGESKKICIGWNDGPMIDWRCIEAVK